MKLQTPLSRKQIGKINLSMQRIENALWAGKLQHIRGSYINTCIVYIDDTIIKIEATFGIDNSEPASLYYEILIVALDHILQPEKIMKESS